MKYVHVRNLQKYHPGYKDRTLQWAKIYFKVVQGDPDCEMITDEIDWGRLIKFILLELEAQKPLPIDSSYLTKKGFNLKKRPIELTLNMLHNFLEVIHSKSENCVIDKDKEEDKDKSKSTKKQLTDEEFLQTLKTSPVYKDIDIDRELGKIDLWLSTRPGKQKTRRFIINWLNRVEKPLAKSEFQQFKEAAKIQKIADPDCKICGGSGKRYPNPNDKTIVVSCNCWM